MIRLFSILVLLQLLTIPNISFAECSGKFKAAKFPEVVPPLALGACPINKDHGRGHVLLEQSYYVKSENPEEFLKRYKSSLKSRKWEGFSDPKTTAENPVSGLVARHSKLPLSIAIAVDNYRSVGKESILRTSEDEAKKRLKSGKIKRIPNAKKVRGITVTVSVTDRSKAPAKKSIIYKPKEAGLFDKPK